jgi:thioredoxin 1
MLELNSKIEFENLCKTHKYVLVDFYAVWCGPCKTMALYLNELNELNHPDLIIVKANVDELHEFSDINNIASLPTVKLFKNSVEILRVEGCSRSHIDSILKEINKN